MTEAHTYNLRELVCLAWLARQDKLGSVRVWPYRDAADVGWLEATIWPTVRGSYQPQHSFKLSPLGIVYDREGKVLLDLSRTLGHTPTAGELIALLEESGASLG